MPEQGWVEVWTDTLDRMRASKKLSREMLARSYQQLAVSYVLLEKEVPGGVARRHLQRKLDATPIRFATAADRAMQLRHLEEAERHVAEGERLIAELRDLIADLARHGHERTEARRLLDTFYDTQLQHIQHRDRILRELAR